MSTTEILPVKQLRENSTEKSAEQNFKEDSQLMNSQTFRQK